MKPAEVQAPTPWWMRLLVGRRPAWTLARAFLWVVVAVIIFKFMLVPVKVQGISMAPTYQDGRVNFINRLSYRFHPPQRGDVVGIRFVGMHAMLLKRVIALPGERISIRDGVVYINGDPLDEPYVKRFNNEWERDEEVLPPNEYLVIGDNRSMRQSEHTHGRVSGDRIVGKVLF